MAMNFKYERVGHIIMLEEKDWERIKKFLQKSGVVVEETPNKARTRLPVGGGTLPAKKNYRKVSLPAKSG